MFKLEEGKKNSIEIKGVNNIIMIVRSGTSRETKYQIMEKWYREQLRKKILKLKCQGLIMSLRNYKGYMIAKKFFPDSSC